MITKIKIKPNTILHDILLFEEMTFDKINLLCGPNSVGKTTLVNDLIHYFTKSKESGLDVEYDKNMELYTYINSLDNVRYADMNPHRSYAELSNPSIRLLKLASQAMSEGQAVMYSFTDILDNLTDLPFNDESDILVVVDEMDSGLSVDNIDYVMTKILELSEVREDVQFVITFNNYAVCQKVGTVKSMITGETINMMGYNDFYKFISMNHNVVLEKRKNSVILDKY